MSATHFVFLVEEPSMEAFLHALLPRFLPEGRTFQVISFQGKYNLLKQLEPRLKGYARSLPEGWRIVVLVDRDSEDCVALKAKLNAFAAKAGLPTRTTAAASDWRLVNRIVIEELEAWYFGDWDGVRAAYPRVPATIAAKERYRNPDAISGGTWEAFEKVMKQHGYFKEGIGKIDAARHIGAHLNPLRNSSQSFQTFWAVLFEVFALQGGEPA
jgi:hypothetical protein